jgi:hypothetical protein
MLRLRNLIELWRCARPRKMRQTPWTSWWWTLPEVRQQRPKKWCRPFWQNTLLFTLLPSLIAVSMKFSSHHCCYWTCRSDCVLSQTRNTYWHYCLIYYCWFDDSYMEAMASTKPASMLHTKLWSCTWWSRDNWLTKLPENTFSLICSKLQTLFPIHVYISRHLKRTVVQ